MFGMANPRRYRQVAGALALFAMVPSVSWAQAATYRCVDDVGRSTYTNIKEEKIGRAHV